MILSCLILEVCINDSHSCAFTSCAISAISCADLLQIPLKSLLRRLTVYCTIKMWNSSEFFFCQCPLSTGLKVLSFLCHHWPGISLNVSESLFEELIPASAESDLYWNIRKSPVYTNLKHCNLIHFHNLTILIQCHINIRHSFQPNSKRNLDRAQSDHFAVCI